MTVSMPAIAAQWTTTSAPRIAVRDRIEIEDVALDQMEIRVVAERFVLERVPREVVEDDDAVVVEQTAGAAWNR